MSSLHPVGERSNDVTRTVNSQSALQSKSVSTPYPVGSGLHAAVVLLRRNQNEVGAFAGVCANSLYGQRLSDRDASRSRVETMILSQPFSNRPGRSTTTGLLHPNPVKRHVGNRDEWNPRLRTGLSVRLQDRLRQSTKFYALTPDDAHRAQRVERLDAH